MRLFAGTPWDVPPRCERCEALIDDCRCPPIEPVVEKVPPERQTAKLAVEKRQKGKWVTAVRGLSSAGNQLEELVTQLKNHCGAGGTVKDGVIEIQGEHRQRVAELLSRLGYKVK